jgi:hypothetical protein
MTTTATEYELKRKRNIQRNNEYLKSLGLLDTRELREKPVKNVTRKEAAVVARRRSTRAAEPNKKPPSLRVTVSSSLSSSQVEIKPIDALLALPAFPFAVTKSEAMHKIAAADATFKFSKLSGIQSFQNAIVLFVNIDGGAYENLFLDDSMRLIQWFAQARQSLDSPVIARIVGGDCNVLLVVRELGEPYHFCGRVHVESCLNATARPLAFSLRLLDRPMPKSRNAQN